MNNKTYGSMIIRKKPIHTMKRRSPGNDYNMPGIYHITITVFDRKRQSLGSIKGSLDCPDGHPDAPRVELTAIGKMVEHELLHSITEHYPVIEIQDYVIMPEHLHFLAVVKNSLISKNGRMTHLGQVIAGFKKGCNRRYWEMTEQPASAPSGAVFPAVSPQGCVLVSARISKGEQEIIDEAIQRGHPVALVVDNGFPTIYHPSEQRLSLCSDNRLLLLSPWTYRYHHHDEEITVAQCKTMNCVVQAVCRLRDDWWKQ